jgi:diguanylate cyclase (GGDEF)-like protein
LQTGRAAQGGAGAVAETHASKIAAATNASLGQPKAQRDWIDVISEGGAALMALVWLIMVVSSRPAGRVTRLLVLGLAGIMLGAFADCMDEFFVVGKGQLWHHVLEGGFSLGGMLTLTLGLFYWRQEQFVLNQHLQKRERVFRSHRGFDHLTQLQDADYLRQQIMHEQARLGESGQSAVLAMLDVDSFHQINRTYGQAEGDKVLQALSHLLLLNLRPQDLLCRYAGDRFVVLMPDLSVSEARAACDHLCLAVSSLRHHTGQAVIKLSMRHVQCPALGDAAQLLSTLSAQLARPAPGLSAGGIHQLAAA